jgi:acetyltransferase-like isoleucine patch superfamily enzyme
MDYFRHSTSEVSEKAKIGKGTKIWHYVQIREGAQVGADCILGKEVYVDFDVRIGDNVKIQNRVSIYHGVIIEDGVFIGPHVCFTNDKVPRAIDEEGNLKSTNDWSIGKILVKKGASIGAGSVILPNITIGEYAMIGAGSVVTKDVPDYALVYGNPARMYGRVDKAGNKTADL